MSEEQVENNAGEKCPLCDSPVERDGNNKSCTNKGCPFWYWWPSDMAIDKVKLFRAENDALRAQVAALTAALDATHGELAQYTKDLAYAEADNDSLREQLKDATHEAEVRRENLLVMQGRLLEQELTEKERRDFLRQTIGSPSLEHFAVRWKELTEALETIAACTYCMGPGCPYCDDGTHPPSHEARIARRALGQE